MRKIENLQNCELRLRKTHNFATNTIHFLSAVCNRKITQFKFLEGRNCEIAKNFEIGEKTIFVCEIQQSQLDFESGITISQLTQFDFGSILQP